ncbi:Predicted O-methyltransferase YrrM [Micromonospora haikouensis]|uniref:Predicted O-methyltransferase YrrM n=1 Tax=Micromonospora haikouensis TaxID=686309 RepID=A0A1C4XL16_9ACTN|nr:O-methyltransferase [Micromonospora haikouensis]SCF09032.1 Predicted O-methyltransferase YrrM [Micromonospora haikouensis]
MSSSLRGPLPIVPQDSTDAGELYATSLVRMAALPAAVDEVLREIEDVAREEQIPVVGRLEGMLLQTLASLPGASTRRILDIGTAIGYSAIWLARALAPGGRVTTIEIDPVRAGRAARFIDRAGYADRVDVLVGDAFDMLPELGEFDVIFQDVMKHRYFGDDPSKAAELLKLSKSHLAPQGVLFIDNAFCGNHVLDEGDPDSIEARGVRLMNELLAQDTDFTSVILPVRDGLWVARRS